MMYLEIEQDGDETMFKVSKKLKTSNLGEYMRSTFLFIIRKEKNRMSYTIQSDATYNTLDTKGASKIFTSLIKFDKGR